MDYTRPFAEVLLDASINFKPGNPTYNTTCPQCSHLRKKKRDECLTVRIKGPNHVVWGCNHCGWTGPEKSASGAKAPRPSLIYYDYADRLRKVKFYKNGKKLFFWQHNNGDGEWLNGTNGQSTEGLLYRIDEAKQMAHDSGLPIFVVEGEKDVGTLMSHGFPATCNAHGASEPGRAPKWTACDSLGLASCDVVVLNDNDPAGIAHADHVAKSLFGTANSVEKIDMLSLWPLAKIGDDITDWFERGGGEPKTLVDWIDGSKKPPPPTGGPPPPPPPPASPGQPPAAGWQSLWITEGRPPRPIPVVANAIITLENDKYKDAFIYDEMLLMPSMAQSPPVPVTDDDTIKIQDWMQHLGLKRMGRSTVQDAIEHVSRKKPFHPIKDYLNALRWDGVSRLRGAAVKYLGADDTLYNSHVVEMFLIQMVSRVLKPGRKADYMLVLEGPQGILKSTFCKTLAGEEYFSDDLPDRLHDKDTKLHLRGKWLIEIAEMHVFDKQEAAALKSFLTKTEERYRLPYGHFETVQPRQCVFMGTSNKDAYLRDDTGARRFWPIKCGTIDIDALIVDRDQLFAEAVEMFRDGAKWWPDTSFERDFIAPQQAERFEDDAWVGPIVEFLIGKTETSLEAVAKYGLNVDVAKLSIPDQRRIGSILRQLAWKKRQVRRGDMVVKKWFKIGNL